jgi:hypothetical protein
MPSAATSGAVAAETAPAQAIRRHSGQHGLVETMPNDRLDDIAHYYSPSPEQA